MAAKAKIKKEAPLLSVGIIFKNEIRCIERCLTSLQPMREKIRLEIVMADTGSDDGSREIAEKYADLVFDFPWINDFSAARNAVLDRCRGTWVLMVDCDEWLDDGASDLAGFLRSSLAKEIPCWLITMRNFSRADLGGEYSDVLVPRLLRRSCGVRYVGAVHEHWDKSDEIPSGALAQLRFNHDGYVGLGGDSPEAKAKRARNQALIDQELRNDPDCLKLMIERFESCENEDKEKYIRLALDGLDRRVRDWKNFGPSALRYAVFVGVLNELPEMEEWAAQARELFPDSPMTRIDVAYVLVMERFHAGKYDEVIPIAEDYLRAVGEFREGRDLAILANFGVVTKSAPESVSQVRTMLADAYCNKGRYQDAWDTVSSVDGSQISADTAWNLLSVLMKLQSEGGMDLRAEMPRIWGEITAPVPTGEASEERRENVVKSGLRVFTPEFRAGETKKGFHHHAYTLFLPLEGKCVLGDMAALLDSGDPDELTAILARQEDLKTFPTDLLLHALEHGADFPVQGKPMNMEELDTFAVSLAGLPERLRAYALNCAAADFAADWQSMDWTRAVVMAAVRGFDWKDGDGLALARAFATVERAYLPRCYTREALDAPAVLPPLHRMGLYCSRAFDALDADDFVAAVRALREGLENCPEMKPMTEFLLDEVQRREKQNAAQDAPPELRQLAEQVKTILAAYPPDDPAVAELKNSPAYQKVAYLIEEL